MVFTNSTEQSFLYRRFGQVGEVGDGDNFIDKTMTQALNPYEHQHIKQPLRYKENRKCRECQKILSIYNNEIFCFACWQKKELGEDCKILYECQY